MKSLLALTETLFQAFWQIVLLAAFAVAFGYLAGPAFSSPKRVAILKHDYVQGSYRMCVYDLNGEDYIVTIAAEQVCKATIKV